MPLTERKKFCATKVFAKICCTLCASLKAKKLAVHQQYYDVSDNNDKRRTQKSEFNNKVQSQSSRTLSTILFGEL